MVAQKVGRAPLEPMIAGCTTPERVKLRKGIAALADLEILVLERGEVCITNRSEMLFQGLENLSLGTVQEVEESLRDAPKFALLLKRIDEDPRLAPP